jgi:hypothetical protein
VLELVERHEAAPDGLACEPQRGEAAEQRCQCDLRMQAREGRA